MEGRSRGPFSDKITTRRDWGEN